MTILCNSLPEMSFLHFIHDFFVESIICDQNICGIRISDQLNLSKNDSEFTIGYIKCLKQGKNIVEFHVFYGKSLV